MSDEPTSPPDLAAFDLAKSFQPSWAQDSAASKPAARFSDFEPREEKSGRRGDRRDRREPRGERRPPRREGGRDNRPRRDERKPERAPAQPEPVTGWEIQFLPDKHGVDGLAKQIKTTAKAYPLFDLARLVLDKSARYNVEFKRTSETATPLFQLKADGTLWLSERDAVNRALAAQIEKFYRRERIAVDPPKGDFPCVAVCGMSGTLLGPPNYHDYQSKLIRLHAERYANMPFEAFKSRVRMERGEEIVARWREEQSAKDVYFPLDLSKPAPAAAPKPEAAPESAATSEPAPEPVGEPPAESEMPAIDAVPEPVAAPQVEAPAEAAPVEEPAAESVDPAPETAAPERLESLAEVERHFREHHLAKAVTRIRERVVVPGPAALNHSAPAVLQLTRALWDQLNRFPLPLAHRLAQHLSSRGVQIFKAQDNVTHAGVARPHYLDRTSSPIAEGPSAILDYLEAHPKVPRGEQWKALLALRSVPAEGVEDTRETALAADLLWLLHQGHVIDFARRNLEAARKPKVNPPKAAKKPAASIPVESVTAEPAVIEPAGADFSSEEPPAGSLSEAVVDEPVAEISTEPPLESPAEEQTPVSSDAPVEEKPEGS